MIIKRDELKSKIGWILLFLNGSLFYFVTLMDVVLVAVIIVASLYMMIVYHRNTILFIISLMLFYFNYSIGLFYWFDVFEVRAHQSVLWFTQDAELMKIALWMFYLFEFLFCILCPMNYRDFNIYEEEFLNEKNRNTPIALFMMSIAVVITGYDMFRTLSKGAYIQTSIFEYLSIIYILGFYYSCKAKVLRSMLLITLIIDCIYVFINGDRGSAIQFILISYFMIFSKKIKGIRLLIYIILGSLFLIVIGSWRNQTSFSVSLIQSAIEGFVNSGILSDTAYYAAGSGLSFIKLANDYSVTDRLLLFVQFLLSMIIGSNFLRDYIPLSTLSYQKYPYHAFGGFLPYYGYFYLGILGTMLFAFISSSYIRIISDTRDDTTDFQKLLCVYIAITTYRWYLYSPSQLIRGPILLYVLYKFLELVFGKYTVHVSIAKD